MSTSGDERSALGRSAVIVYAVLALYGLVPLNDASLLVALVVLVLLV